MKMPLNKGEMRLLPKILGLDSKKILTSSPEFFPKVTNVSGNVCETAAKNNGGKKPVYFSSGDRYLERSFAVEFGASRLANMIKVQNLVKIFGTKRAVDGVSFSVERGEVLGFLGPNGAGKSTSMRMITGFIPPTEGTVTVGGFDMVENPIPAKRLIGYLPENAPAYTDMTVKGFLAFAAELRGFRGDAKREVVVRPIG